MEPQASAAPHVYVAITAVRAALAKDGIQKNRLNKGGGNYKFRGIDDVYNACSSLLADNNLCVMPNFSERQQIERRNADDKALFWTTVRGAFTFVSAVDGSQHTVVAYGEAFDTGDKGTNKAMSMAMKYAMLETFTVPTDAAADADEETHTVAGYSEADKQVLSDLNTAAAAGRKSLKAAWQKLDEGTRERVRRELDTLSKVADQNDAAPAKAEA